ncbi:MAG: DUF268 domain-containing protein [Bacteroidia bacterium]
MKNIVYFFYFILGYRFKDLYKRIGAVGWYFTDLREIKKQLKNNPEFKIGRIYPCLMDKTAQSGNTKSPYFYQDLYVAQRVFINGPQKHTDIGSSISGFVAHVASFREIEVIDIRPLDSTIKNVTFVQLDMMDDRKLSTLQYESISSLHAIEHFGLGRYGDPIDVNGHIKAIQNIHKIIKQGGRFYFSVPIGPQRIEFNAHRVFSLTYLIKNLEDKFTIERFSYIDDKFDFFENVTLDPKLIANNYNCNLGCGIFELIKK